VIRHTAQFLGRALPFPVRRRLATAAGHLPGGFEFCMGMLDDLRRRDPDALHRFLWSNHLAYAQSYQVRRKFGASNINPTRHLLFHQITAHLGSIGLDPRQDVRSVFEVGCSMGYLLRHLEEEVFPAADTLHGLDIDGQAIQAGTAHLTSLGSRVRLFNADMLTAGEVMGHQIYDVVLCCGALMYVNETAATSILQSMFSHARRLVGLVCLAPSGRDPGCSEVRSADGAFIHHMDRMIHGAGGRVLSSQWVGTEISGSSPSQVILARQARWEAHLTEI
jgi:SAM-dependent methyltransferase